MAGDENPTEMCDDYVDHLRGLVKTFIDRHHYESALFWAEKIMSLTKGEARDVYWYAQTLFLTGQYHRAAHLVKTNKLDKKYAAGRYLAARCHYECREYTESMEILDQSENNFLGAKMPAYQGCFDDTPHIPYKNMESSINLLRGKVYEAMENRNLAAECFREALRCDVFCYEAFDSLVNHHTMTAQEEQALLATLPFSKQCTETESALIQFLYENKLKKYSKPGALSVPDSFPELSTNLEVAVGLAERHYYNCDLREAYKAASGILKLDPYNWQCLPLYVAILVDLKKSNELFALAHKLVDMYPSKAVSWFATGCYYLLVGKNDPARRYLSKATTVDRVFGPAWLAFGHSFAVENEHDQAMAAYFTASQLMRGCHLPVLYIGLEYGLTNNAKLAERFFTQALSIAPEDPFVLHEMGVVAFKNQDYSQAETYLQTALEKIESVSHEVMVDKWEPLLNNLGHVCRKLHKYEDALDYHRHALVLQPQNPATLSAMGYIHALMGNPASAVDYFHKALGLRRDDTFSKTMLEYSLEQMMTDVPESADLPDSVPEFTTDLKLAVMSSPLSDNDVSVTSPASPTSPGEDTSLGLVQHSPADPLLGLVQDSAAETSIEMDVTMGDASMAIDTDLEDT